MSLIEDVDFEKLSALIREKYDKSFKWTLGLDVFCASLADCLNEMGYNIDTNKVMVNITSYKDNNKTLNFVRHVANVLYKIGVVSIDKEKRAVVIEH